MASASTIVLTIFVATLGRCAAQCVPTTNSGNCGNNQELDPNAVTSGTTAADCCMATVNCQGSWGNYGACSPPGDACKKSRAYAVTTYATPGGNACMENGATRVDGDTQETTSGCTGTPACGVDCAGTFGSWGSCSAACATGTQSRSFTTSTPRVAPGVACPPSETRDCNTHACPINCEGGWGAGWDDCTVSCGPGGTQERTYAVTTAAQHDGTPCPENDGTEQVQACNEDACGEYEQAGACAILGYKTTGGDDFRVAFLVSIPSGAQVHATDRGWDNDFDTVEETGWPRRRRRRRRRNWGDGDREWKGTKTGGVSAGTVLTKADFSGSGNVDFTANGDGDQVFIYLGTHSAPTVFLCGFNQKTDWDWNPNTANGDRTSDLPTSVTAAGGTAAQFFVQAANPVAKNYIYAPHKRRTGSVAFLQSIMKDINSFMAVPNADDWDPVPTIVVNGCGGPCQACAMEEWYDCATNCQPADSGQTGACAACAGAAGCPAGKFYSGAAADTCLTEKSDMDDSGAGDCTPCPVGKYVAVTGSDEVGDCIDCVAGKYVGVTGYTTDCIPCPNGRYVDVVGSDALADCINCVKGKYIDVTGSDAASDCIACATGQASGAGAASCESCTSGQYIPPGETDCIDCPAGKYVDVTGSIDVGDCGACESADCIAGCSAHTCSAGTLKAGAASIYGIGATDALCCDAPPCTVHICSAGILKADAGSITGATDELCCDAPACMGTTPLYSAGCEGVCHACPAPNIVDSGRETCYACGPGKQPNVHHTACVDCAGATYSPFGVACTECEAPWVVSASKAECGLCPAGNGPGLAATTCEACVGPSFSTAGQCQECRMPNIVDDGHISCGACLAGTMPSAERTACVLCTGATYSPCGIECQPCRPPSVVNTQQCTGADDGQGSVCTLNTAGDGCAVTGGDCQYLAGRTMCSSCPAGTGPNAEQAGCELCVGAFYSTFGVCQECIPPSVVSAYRISCKTPSRCEPGTECPDGVACDQQSDCTPCPAGSVSSAGSECQGCSEPGKVSNLLQTFCQSCLAGSAPSSDRSSCESCVGTTVSGFGIECQECAPPSVVNTARTTCSSCPAGKGPNADHMGCEGCRAADTPATCGKAPSEVIGCHPTDGTGAMTTADTPICDLDAITDTRFTLVDGTALCPPGCSANQVDASCTGIATAAPTCDLDATTDVRFKLADGTALCPPGCITNQVEASCSVTCEGVAYAGTAQQCLDNVGTCDQGVHTTRATCEASNGGSGVFTTIAVYVAASDGTMCDLDGRTDGTADCPAGCADIAFSAPTECTGDATVPTCDLDARTDSTAACPTGCTNVDFVDVTECTGVADTPTCDLDSSTYCPAGCTEVHADFTTDASTCWCADISGSLLASCADMDKSGGATPATVFQICDLDAATDGTAVCPAGCVDTAGRAMTVCTDTNVDGTATPAADGSSTCDLDATTDGTADCPTGCTNDEVIASCTGTTSTVALTCDLLETTDGTAVCHAGCTFDDGCTSAATCVGTAAGGAATPACTFTPAAAMFSTFGTCQVRK